MPDPVNLFLGFVYALSLAACIAFILQAMQSLKDGDAHADSSMLIVGMCGFAIVPAINTFVALACIPWAMKGFAAFDFGNANPPPPKRDYEKEMAESQAWSDAAYERSVARDRESMKLMITEKRYERRLKRSRERSNKNRVSMS